MTKTTVLALVALSASVLVGQANAQSPDNSQANKTDQSNMTATADSQKNNASDLDLTKRIRKSVIADKSLSTYAHNVKIIAVNGNVTLNGVVRSDDEKNAIEMKAAAVAGKGNVVDDLKVAPAN
jgi:hyperosmotically inducible protein